MLGTRLRNGKSRMLIALPVGVLLVLGLLIFHDINTKLNEARSTSEKCQQHEESLSAQLQVVFEHKSRLEKSLQGERNQFKKTKDELQAQNQELRDDKEKEKQEAASRFNSLQQQHKMLQIQLEDLQEDLHKVQQSNQDLLNERQQLHSNLNTQIELGKQKEDETKDLKSQVRKLQYEIQVVNNQILDRNQRVEKLEAQLKDCQELRFKSSKLDTIGNKKMESNQSIASHYANSIGGANHQNIENNLIENPRVETNEINGPLKPDINILPRKSENEEMRKKKSVEKLIKDTANAKEDLEDNAVLPLNKPVDKEDVADNVIPNNFPVNAANAQYPFGNGLRALGGGFQKNVQQLEKPNDPREAIAAPEHQQLVVPESGRLLGPLLVQNRSNLKK